VAGPPAIENVPVSIARQRFGELINQVYRRQARVIIEKNGLPAVALVAIGDLERWLSMEARWSNEEPESRLAERSAIADFGVLRAPTGEELAQRQALVEAILANAERRSISPHTTSDLLEEAREEREQAHERWTR
jgi:prevent-host-death family protein